MGRRGHDPFSWGVVGVLLGPVGAAFALCARSEGRTVSAARRTTTGHQGPVDVLVGLDGSRLAEVAAVSAVQLLGTRIGRLTAVTVITSTALSVGSPVPVMVGPCACEGLGAADSGQLACSVLDSGGDR
jgi:hypothetical protein